jgi:hypothetical protein
MAQIAAAFAVGIIFARLDRFRNDQSARVIGFLDVAGRWDPPSARHGRRACRDRADLSTDSASVKAILARNLVCRRRADRWAAYSRCGDFRRRLRTGGFCPDRQWLAGLGSPGVILFVVAMILGNGWYRVSACSRLLKTPMLRRSIASLNVLAKYAPLASPLSLFEQPVKQNFSAHC